MKRWRLRGCPKCGGDQWVQKNEYFYYFSLSRKCLQCGFEEVIDPVIWKGQGNVRKGTPRKANGVLIR